LNVDKEIKVKQRKHLGGVFSAALGLYVRFAKKNMRSAEV
jgi:hypothetical protein